MPSSSALAARCVEGAVLSLAPEPKPGCVRPEGATEVAEGESLCAPLPPCPEGHFGHPTCPRADVAGSPRRTTVCRARPPSPLDASKERCVFPNSAGVARGRCLRHWWMPRGPQSPSIPEGLNEGEGRKTVSLYTSQSLLPFHWTSEGGVTRHPKVRCRSSLLTRRCAAPALAARRLPRRPARPEGWRGLRRPAPTRSPELFDRHTFVTVPFRGHPRVVVPHMPNDIEACLHKLRSPAMPLRRWTPCSSEASLVCV